MKNITLTELEGRQLLTYLMNSIPFEVEKEIDTELRDNAWELMWKISNQINPNVDLNVTNVDPKTLKFHDLLEDVYFG